MSCNRGSIVLSYIPSSFHVTRFRLQAIATAHSILSCALLFLLPRYNASQIYSPCTLSQEERCEPFHSMVTFSLKTCTLKWKASFVIRRLSRTREQRERKKVTYNHILWPLFSSFHAPYTSHSCRLRSLVISLAWTSLCNVSVFRVKRVKVQLQSKIDKLSPSLWMCVLLSLKANSFR